MLDQEDDDLRIVLGVLFGVIALVIALVTGLGVHSLHRAKAPAKAEVVMAEEVYAEVEPQGDALVMVYFAVGEAAVPAESAEGVAKVKMALGEKAEAIVLLSGFHDETGDPAANAVLAKNRAMAVKEALVAAGVPAEKVLLRKPAVTTGSGNADEARRVEIRVQ